MSQTATQAKQDREQTQRQFWISVLARSSSQELQDKWSAFAELYPELNKIGYKFLRKPETGLTMVRARAGGDGQRFNLGEMSLTRCAVAIEGGQIGYGYVRGRDHKQAELAAIYDALLMDDQWAEPLLRDVIAPLAETQKTIRENRKRKVAASKVDFFTMVRGEDE